MTEPEFDAAARRTAARLAAAPLADRIAVACRGSGNPAALAWLAEECGIGTDTRIADLGGGLGGPAAWITEHYHPQTVVALDPACGAVSGASRLFDVPVVRGDAADAPFRDRSFDLALLLGVLSVVVDPTRVVREAGRIATRVAVLEYCSTGAGPLGAGGSCFPTRAGLDRILRAGRFAPRTAVELTLATPPRWTDLQERFDATDDEPDASRAEHRVTEAVAAGRLVPWLVCADRG